MNWSPILLISVDAKIADDALALRMTKVLDKIVSCIQMTVGEGGI